MIRQKLDQMLIVIKLHLLRHKLFAYSDFGPVEKFFYPPIRIIDGQLNSEGRRVADYAVAKYLQSKCLDLDVTFAMCLERARWLNDQLGINGLKKLGLGDLTASRGCFAV